ncbi:MAG: hypothetical protein ACI4M3_00985 [Acutalibacteraceae bacterium]
MKNKIKYIISIVLVVFLTGFFMEAPQWYYAFSDKNMQSDYGTQDVSLSSNEITAAQFFTLMRSGNATQMQINNIDGSQVISGLSNSISNMKKYMEEHSCEFAKTFLGYLQNFEKEFTIDNQYFFQSVTGVVDNELLSTVVCMVSGQIQDDYAAYFIFDYNTNILYTVNLTLPSETIKYIDENALLEFQKALLSYWKIDEENLWWDIGRYGSIYNSSEEIEDTGKYPIYFNINDDIAAMLGKIIENANEEMI